jgi:hypothetical protein
MTVERYRACPSPTEPELWNVLDLTRRNRWGEIAVEIPLVSEAEARRGAEALNAGREPYRWRGNDPRCRP